MKLATAVVFSTLTLLSCGPGAREVLLQAGDLEVGVSDAGTIISFSDATTGKDYLPDAVPAPLLSIRVNGEVLNPTSADYQEEPGTLSLWYEGGREAQVKVQEKPTHLTLELMSLSSTEGIEVVIWGPYPTTISETIGETVGVVRGQGFAVGLQALNPKTLGGFPWNENDAMPQLDIFESGDFSDMSEEGKRHVLYRVEAAKPDTFGSTLQAFTRQRDSERIVENWGHQRYTAPPFDDGGVVGSKIALFGCLQGEALATIGEIEVAEGLPHPTIDGEWGKMAAGAAAAYVILPFSEATVDRAVDLTLEAGLRYLYHSGPFETWGHFQLGQDFPNGWDGMKAAVEKAEARGVLVGVHTLSNFITTNDPYVTPVPDSRLARVGYTLLTHDLTASAEELGIESPEFLNQFENNHLRAAVVGAEIIRYREVSQEPPWRLLGVERGAFGTAAAGHSAGDSIGKLADHAYRVFLSNAELSQDMGATLADFFNQTGLRQISFDGLEGNRSTGMGNYGEILFTSAWYDALSDDIRSHYIADASRTSHYFWHIYSRMNWGEPWYAGFRESQTEYRLKNQAYFRRNMMPGMLGWFQMRPETSVEDIEWMLARSAAFDAGYAFVTSFEAVDANGRSDEILDLIGSWEEARMTRAFSPEQKTRMEDIANEFHLERAGTGAWTLHQIYPTVARVEIRDRQPGEPTHGTIPFENLAPRQNLHFVLTAEGASMDGVFLELNGSGGIDLRVALGEGESLVYEGGSTATHYSPQWQVLREVALDGGGLAVGPGSHTLLVDPVGAEGEGSLKVEVRIWGEAEEVVGS